MDYGSRGGHPTLPILSWSRANTEDEVATRAFPVPCTKDKTHNDTRVPFTCGSEARRSVIKYFVRNYTTVPGTIPGTCGTEDLNRTIQDANLQRLINLVHTRLNALYYEWSDPTKLECEQRSSNGTRMGVYGFQFCNPKDSDTWSPAHLWGWDIASGADVSFIQFSSNITIHACCVCKPLGNVFVTQHLLHHLEVELVER